MLSEEQLAEPRYTLAEVEKAIAYAWDYLDGSLTTFEQHVRTRLLAAAGLRAELAGKGSE